MDLFDLVAKITLDTSEYEKGIDGAGKKASVFGDVLKANLATKGFELAAKDVAKLGQSFFDMIKQSVGSYAEYEQLVGGVETLFKESADTVQQYAANAYKTAGLSANQYMETVTSFSAALVSSLEGDYSKAAQVSDMAITDMADNANKMGTSMESIQAAYQGFAKQNYTMLDNLNTMGALAA
jgi:phage-related protein